MRMLRFCRIGKRTFACHTSTFHLCPLLLRSEPTSSPCGSSIALCCCWRQRTFEGCASARVGFQTDGTYVLERGEQSADCQVLHKNIWGRIQILKGLPAKAAAEQQTAPPTASSFFGRLFGGPNKGLAAVQEYDRERAHTRALQRTMVEKKCIAVPLDSELADVDAEMAKIRSN